MRYALEYLITVYILPQTVVTFGHELLLGLPMDGASQPYNNVSEVWMFLVVACKLAFPLLTTFTLKLVSGRPCRVIGLLCAAGAQSINRDTDCSADD